MFKYGASPNLRWYKCPSNKALGRKCMEMGHSEKCCRNSIGKVDVEESEEDGHLGVAALEVESESAWYADILLNGKTITHFKIDSGADISVIGSRREKYNQKDYLKHGNSHWTCKEFQRCF